VNLQYSGFRLQSIQEHGRTVGLTNGTTITQIQDADGTQRSFNYGSESRLTDDNWGKLQSSFDYDAETGRLDFVDRGQDEEYDIAAAAAVALNSPPGVPADVLARIEAGYQYSSSQEQIVTKITLDAEGRILTRLRPDGSQLTYERDATSHRVVSYTNEREIVTQYTYEKGDVTSITAPDRGTETFQYHPLFRGVIQHQDANGNTSQYEYNAIGQLTLTTDPYGNTIENTWQDYFCTGTKNQRGYWTFYVPDQFDRIYTTTDARANSTLTLYDSSGNIDYVVDRNGHVWDYLYDGKNQLDEATDPEGNRTAYTHDDSGLLLDMTNPRQFVTIYDYDTRGLVVEVIVADGTAAAETVTTLYWPDGQVHQSTDALNRTTTIEPLGTLAERRVKKTDTLGRQYVTTYDAAGNVISLVEPLGRITWYCYDDANRLIRTYAKTTATVMPNGNEGVYVETEYDNVGNVLSVTDEVHVTTSYHYDQLNRRDQILDGEGGLTKFGFDENGNLVWQRDARGASVVHTYDEGDRLKWTDRWDRQLNANGSATVATENWGPIVVTGAIVSDGAHSVQREYDSEGNVLHETDARNHTTDFTYYDNNWLETVTQPLPGTGQHGRPVTTFEYNPNGAKAKVTDPQGRWVEYTYDPLDRIDTVTDPEGVIDHDYHRVNDARFPGGLVRKETVKDKRLNATDSYFDPAGQLYRVVQPNPGTGQHGAPVTEYFFDVYGNQTSVVDPLGWTTTQVFDVKDRLEMVREQVGSSVETVMTYTYYDDGQVHTRQSRGEPVTTLTYDGLKRVLTSTTPVRLTLNGNPVNAVTATAYDAVGNVVQVTAPNSDVTTFVYDDLNRKLREEVTLASGQAVRRFAYDANGNLVQAIDRDLDKIVYAVDNLNRRVGETWYAWDGSLEDYVETGYHATYAYDAASELTGASDSYVANSVNSDFALSYDDVGRVGTITQQVLQLPTVVYDRTYLLRDNGYFVDVTVGQASSYTTGYILDELYRPWKVVQSGVDVEEKVATMEYRADGRVSRIDRFESLETIASNIVASTLYDYSLNNHVEQIRHYGALPGGILISQDLYTYDSNGRLFTTVSIQDGTTTYDYDDVGQLRSVTVAGPVNSSETFQYDINGNRTGSTVVISAHNRLESDGNYFYQYDREGNRILQQEGANGPKSLYEWDQRQRLIRVTDYNASNSVTQRTEYRYDVFDRRVGVLVDTDGDNDFDEETYFSHDGLRSESSGSGDHVAIQFDAAGQATHYFFYGPAVDQIFADENASGDILWPLTDHQGSVRDLANYDAQTDYTSVTGHRTYSGFGVSTQASDFLFGYAGREVESATGLSYNRARFYDSRAGRFLSEDPKGFAAGDANLYRYVGNEPTGKTDPSGLVGDGHHLVPQTLWEGMRDAVKAVFDDDEPGATNRRGARIRGLYYNFHNGSTVNGISHDCYIAEVKRELDSVLGGRQPSAMTSDEAERFLERIKTSSNETISGFNKGVRAEAYIAGQVGEAAYRKAKQRGLNDAFEIGRDAGKLAGKQARNKLNDLAAKKAKWTIGKLLGGLVMFSSATATLYRTGDVSAAGREALLELTGTDTARDAGELLGIYFDWNQSEIEAMKQRMKNSSKWGMKPAYELIPGGQ
jgi:RHS repeat-associated protein